MDYTNTKTWASIVRSKDTLPEQEYEGKIESLKAELIKRETAFKLSYAYTKYRKDSEKIQTEISETEALLAKRKDKEETEYYSSILQRIIDYLGHYFLSNYYTDTGYAATYTLKQTLPPNILTMGLTWSIVERHGSIHLIFQVDSSQRLAKIQSLIETVLPDFTQKIDPLTLS